jgi:flagellar protein FlbD
MIKLTKLDKSPLLVNVEAIKYIESTPDTLIIFQNGDSSFVTESLEEIVTRVVEFKARVLRSASSAPTSSSAGA